MSFIVTDFNDFKELLALHRDWQAELRRMIVGQDLDALPSLIRDLLEAHRGAEQRLTRLEEAQIRAEERLSRLEEAVARLEQTVAGLVKTIEKLVDILAQIEMRMDRIEDRVGSMDGEMLEIRYRDRAGAYFGRWLRRTRVVDPSDLADELRDRLSPEERDDALNIDLVVRGPPADRPDVGEIWLAVEVSATVDAEDVARALKRAGLLRRTGHPVLPAVAGTDATDGAKYQTAKDKVLLLQDGSGQYWDEAVAAWI